MIHLSNGPLAAAISPTGAELRSLTLDGRERMTPVTPDHWQGHAPILFPVIGRVADDTVRVDGQAYPMPKHGLARQAEFSVVETGTAKAHLRLTSSDETRAHYPFDWTLDVVHALTDRLMTTATVTNTGGRAMPFSFGFHPAFAWPQPGGRRDEATIVFAQDEPGQLLEIAPDGLLRAERRDSPLDGRVLALRDDLFERDALVWPQVASCSVRYECGPGALTVRFPDSDTLAIWTQPGAGFVCIEPWVGRADPEGFTGEMAGKPGGRMLAAGDSAVFRLLVEVDGPV